MPDVIVLGNPDEVDVLFKEYLDDPSDGLYVDVDLEAAAALTPQMTLKQHEETMSHSRCPMCDNELGPDERWILKARDDAGGPKSWDCDSLGCATKLLKRMYKETRGVSSSVEFLSLKKRPVYKPTVLGESNRHNCQNVYDR